MGNLRLHLDPTLGHAAGPAPAEMAEGFASDGTPLALLRDPILASLPPPPPTPAPAVNWGEALASLHGTLADMVPLLQWGFLLYFVVMFGGGMLLNLAALARFSRRQSEAGAAAFPPATDLARHEPPVSVIVPAFNDAAAVAATVRAVRELAYSELEIIIVNDGSRDQTLELLMREFSLMPFSEAYRDRRQTRRVRGIYASTLFPRLRLVDKEHGGRADALNAGINCARYPLFCPVDAGSVLQRDSLRVLVRPYLEDADTVAACSSVRPGEQGEMPAGGARLPGALLGMFQVVERMRAFLFAHLLGFRNSLLFVPAAFIVFRKESVVAAGAYRTDAVNGDMELVTRLHRLLLNEGKPYRIAYVPDPLCRKAMPDNWRGVREQRMRWHEGLSQALEMNRELFRARGPVGWLAFPLVLLFEWLGPLVEVVAYLTMTLLWLVGAISLPALGTFMLAAVGLGILLSMSGLLREEMGFRPYPRIASVLALALVAVLENLGYRQLTAFWRALGLLGGLLPAGASAMGGVLRRQVN